MTARWSRRSSFESELHYEFVPGIEPDEDEIRGPFFWYWHMTASDDLGTEYNQNDGGARGPGRRAVATHATRDIGGHIPSEASHFTLTFEPPHDWTPPEPWIRYLRIDLGSGGVTTGGRPTHE